MVYINLYFMLQYKRTIDLSVVSGYILDIYKI